MKAMPIVAALAAALLAPAAGAQGTPTLDQVIDGFVARENALVESLQHYQPLMETYLQTSAPDDTSGTVPVRDAYFLARLGLPGSMGARASASMAGGGRKLLDLFKEFYAFDFRPDGFARMLVLDGEAFDRDHYAFEFVRREFLGEVRTLVFDVTPKENSGPGRFVGRIWVEDVDYNIVRYNGVYTPTAQGDLHFDSWRLNMAPGLWFPAYVYSEESEYRMRGRLASKTKGQTRLWGYELARPDGEDAFTKLMVEDAAALDRTETAGDVSPVKSLRTWQREAEDNVLRRLEKGGLLAPEGPVDEVLRTVVTNLEVTNGLDIEPPVRCRVLMTTPLESFTVGHTIVLSRGLVDVLPDEASLAMVLAHELGHILSGHQLDTSYAFGDRMLFGDRETLKEFVFRRVPKEEAEADEKAEGLLASSPYQDKLGNAGLFLKALSEKSRSLQALIRPHFGNRFAKGDKLFRMNKIVEGAPALDPGSLEQTAALPLGGRVKVDPWTGRIELMKNSQVALLSAKEKLPFEVTPLMPHLARYGSASTEEETTASLP